MNPNRFRFALPFPNNPRRRYALWLVWLLVFSIIAIAALAYPLNPNRIIETWFCLILLHRFPRCFAVVLWLTALAVLLYHPTAALYGRPSFGIVVSLLHTNAGEAREYLSIIPWHTYAASVLWAACAAATAVVGRRIDAPHSPNFRLPAAVMTLAVALMAFSTAKKGYTHGGFPLRMVTLEFFADGYLQYRAYFDELTRFQAALKQPNHWQIRAVHPKYRNYVLVIGESVRTDYMQLYGFPIVDTPFLQQRANLVFDHMYAAGPNTPISLLRGLSLSSPQSFSVSDNIVALANKAGMHTAWLSNQGSLGQYDTSVSVIGHQAQTVSFSKSTSYDFGDAVYDDQLLPKLREVLQTPVRHGQSRLIVLHTLGSHPNPCERLRTAARRYSNNPNSNCYIDSIAATDRLLHDIYNTLAAQNEPFSLLYFSDHGLSHDRDTFSKNPLETSPTVLRHNDRYRQNYHVPLAVINSDGRTQQRISAVRTGFDLTAGLAAWLGIDSPQLPHSSVFFSNTALPENTVLNFNLKAQPINLLENDPLPENWRTPETKP